VRRELSVFVVVTATLVGTAGACGPPRPGIEAQNSAEVQATNVRRTALAEVQRIIANNPPATATPPGTPLPRPTCSGAIWWHEARSHLGELRRVQGPIVGSRPAADGSELLEIGQHYPDPTGVAVLIPSRSNTAINGKTVCVSGQITSSQGIPTLQLSDTSGIVVVD
jgi:hypothetical protein